MDELVKVKLAIGHFELQTVIYNEKHLPNLYKKAQ